MGLRTVAEYQESLRDGRVVYFGGRRVEDVTTHPVIGIAVNHASIDYAIAHDSDYRKLAVCLDPASGEEYSRYFEVPGGSDDLLRRSELIELSTRLGRTLVVLIKEIGTDCLFALQLVARQMDDKLGTDYVSRVRAIYEHCRSNDLAMAVAQTDVKGDRGLGPAEQGNPDYYVRIVERRSDGIIVRGAKVHTSVTPNANELFVVPTRNLGESDADYAVAFCIPASTRGVRMIASPYGSGSGSTFTHPISSRHKMMETLTIFDDVFVPNERVFLNGEWQFAGLLAKTFVEFHRFTAISYKLPLLDLLVGSAQLIADQNGIDRASHVREKLTWLISYAQTVRMLTRMAALDCTIEEGIAIPNTEVVNIAKLHFAANYHQALMHVQDLTGGLLVTGPGEEDLRSPETGDEIQHYLGGRSGFSTEERLRTINMISDLTTGDFGGYQAVLAIHAEGSLEAEKMTILREYKAARAKSYAEWVASPGKERTPL